MSDSNFLSLIGSQLQDCSQQLLDFSKRNPYLNFRLKSAIEFDTCSWKYVLNHVIVRKGSFKVEKPKKEKEDGRVGLFTEKIGPDSPVEEGPKTKAITLCNEKDYKNKFRLLYNKSRLAQSEKGVNVVYLCFGLLHYNPNGSLEEEDSKDNLYAPLLIQPIALSRESLDGPYSVDPDPNEEISTNLTLEEFLKRTLEITLPTYEDTLGDPVQAYLSKIKDLADKKGWVLEQRVFVQCLQYQRLAIYNDITKNVTNIEASPLVDMMFGNESELPLPTIDTDESVTLDKTLTPETNLDVLDADASQDAAIRYAMEGKSIILQGPPGTGKSQTITNIIANAMAKGKRVLFVAQKREALDVVYRNLTRCSFNIVLNNGIYASGTLADFCLYLHDTRTKKKDVMSMLRTAMEYENGHVDTLKRQELLSLIKVRNELNETDFALHQPIFPLGKSVFECYGYVMRCDINTKYAFDVPENFTQTYDQLKAVCLSLATFAKACGNYSDDILLKNPWYGYRFNDIAFTYPPDSLTTIQTWHEQTQGFLDNFKSTINCLKLPGLPEEAINLDSCSDYLHTLGVLLDKRSVSLEAAATTNIDYLKEYLNNAVSLENRAKAALSSIQTNYQSALPLLKFIGMEEPLPNPSQDTLPIANRIAVCLSSSPTIASLVNKGHDDLEVGQQFKDYHSSTLESKQLLDKISSEYKEGVFSLDIEQERKAVVERGFFFLFNKKYQNAKHLLLSYLKTPAKKSGSQVEADYTAISDYQLAAKKSIETKQFLESNCPDLFKLELTDDQAKVISDGCRPLAQLLKSLKDYSSLLADFTKAKMALNLFFKEGVNETGIDLPKLNSDIEWICRIRQLLTDRKINTMTLDALFCQSDYLTLAADKERQLIASSTAYQKIFENINSLFFNIDNAEKPTMAVITLSNRLGKILASPREDYVAYASYYQERQNLLQGRKLASFVAFVESHHIPSIDIPIIYQKTFYERWLQYQINNNKDLGRVSNFSGAWMNNAVSEFQKLDVMQYQTAPAAVAEQVIHRASQSFSVAVDYRRNGQGSLRHEVYKQRKVLPTRVLLANYLDEVMQVTPVLMMSPLSVSTFIKSNAKFDMVIFDEASQITPEDAIGSIYRGRQIVVAGDEEQLPPTDFFNTKLISDDDEDFDEDQPSSSASSYKSILGMFNGTLLHRNQVMLQWHYRSRDESLIDFSNKEIYGSKLITFPSPKQGDESQGVHFVYVPNGYWIGSGEGNPNEAQVVAQNIISFFKKYGDVRNRVLKRSLGVVAFGVSQANAVETALNDLLEQPENERYQIFASDTGVDEPFFIKNLETVQGDQRDVIFLSVGYGKDSYGNKLLRYGPVQSEGGYRRLNVAITRAKYSVVVFSSVHGGEIPVERATADTKGICMLRDYLNYAESTNKAQFLATDAAASGLAPTESPFEEEVYLFLRKHNVKVTKQVGCSSYRIDFGIENPEKSGSFVLAVECDGATYHSAKNARERDRLRQQELELMGWNFYRIWSTDWFRDPEGQGRKLLDAIDLAVSKANEFNSVQVSLKP
jgi:very-short-patch-repair endonuclease